MDNKEALLEDLNETIDLNTPEYGMFKSKEELQSFLQAGIDDIEAGRLYSLEEVIEEINRI